MKNNVLLWVLFVVMLPYPGVAVGQAPTLTVDCRRDPACASLKEQAAECSKRDDLVGALRLYRLAYEVRPDPRLLFNIARLLHKQGKPGEAGPYYQKFLDSPIQDQEDAEQRQKAREYLTQVQVVTPAAKPVYKKWWFWVALGGGVLAASSVTAGVILGTSGKGLPDNTAMFSF